MGGRQAGSALSDVDLGKLVGYLDGILSGLLGVFSSRHPVRTGRVPAGAGAGVPTEPRTFGTFGVLGLLVVLISATSFSRALTRMYARRWRVSPPGRLRGVWRWIVALLGIAAALIVLGLLRSLWESVPYDTALDVLTAFLVSTVVWLWRPWVLLAGAVSGTSTAHTVSPASTSPRNHAGR